MIIYSCIQTTKDKCYNHLHENGKCYLIGPLCLGYFICCPSFHVTYHASMLVVARVIHEFFDTGYIQYFKTVEIASFVFVLIEMTHYNSVNLLNVSKMSYLIIRGLSYYY